MADEIDWTGCDAVEIKPVPCIKGTDIPAWLVVSWDLGGNLNDILEGRDEAAMDSIVQFAKEQ
jgi:hypothetical protein